MHSPVRPRTDPPELMAIFPGTEPIIEAARHWKQAFLLNRRGVLEDNEYSAEAFDEIKKRFVDNPMEGDSSFFIKLEEQMKGASPEACGLMAELFWVLHLAVRKLLKPETKRRQIQEIWQWGGSDLRASRWLEDEILSGVGGPGGGFSMRKWRELGMTVLLFQDWWKLPAAEKKELCNDHARFAQWVERKEYSKGRQFRDMLLHLLFPEHFERIFSQRQSRLRAALI